MKEAREQSQQCGEGRELQGPSNHPLERAAHFSQHGHTISSSLFKPQTAKDRDQLQRAPAHQGRALSKLIPPGMAMIQTQTLTGF